MQGLLFVCEVPYLGMEVIGQENLVDLFAAERYQQEKNVLSAYN